MNLSDSKKKLALAGVACGIVAAVLAATGNPANMAICIACFVRDTAGALKLHSAAAVQYARPEIIGIVVGAFAISAATKEYRSTGGILPDDPFRTGNDHHDRFPCVPWLPASDGDPDVRR